MAEALEWFQCKQCGRRQRWVADWAGRTLSCPCGAKVICPSGPELSDTALGDTLIESADAPTSKSTWSEIVEKESAGSPRVAQRLAYGTQISATAAREANKSFVIWSAMLLIGISMVIHVAILWPHSKTYAPFWVYAGLAALIAPLSIFKFRTARLRWQRGRPFWEAFAQTLGADSEE